MKTFVLAALCSASLAMSAQAATVSVSVDANGDSTNLLGGGPVGGSTGVNLTAGQSFSITASGLWNLGGGEAPFGPDGTDAYFGLCVIASIPSVRCGALVGVIGSGNYFLVGSSFSGVAGATGELLLRIVDNDFANNSGSVTARIMTGDTQPSPSPVPLPAGVWLGLTGVAALVAARRRKA